jgi:hypothetical protein
MSNVRKTGKDLMKEYQDLNMKRLKLMANTTTRLSELSKQFPDAPIGKEASLDGAIIKAGSLTNNYINGLEIDVQIMYIQIIEEWIASQYPHKQLDIEYEEEPNKNKPLYNS